MENVPLLAGSNPVIFWLFVATAAGVAEAATVGLFSVWFVIGALAAAVPAWLGASFNVQAAVFIAASALALAFTRPFFRRVLRVERTPTNADRLIGAEAVVTAEIDNIVSRGRVLADGLEWAARSADGLKIEKGAAVKILEISGVTLTVKRTHNDSEEK